MGIKKQTRSRVWSWNQQGCEVPWCKRTGISHSKCQISTAVNNEASAGVGCGRMRCSAAAGRSGLRRGTSASRATPGSPPRASSRCRTRPGPTQAASISPAAPRLHTPGSGHVAYLAADPNQNPAFSSPEPPSFPRPPGGGGDGHRKHPPRRRWLAPGT